jgi:hypothetical protein
LIAAPLLMVGIPAAASVWASVEEGKPTYFGFFAAMLSLTVFFYGCVVYGGLQRFGNAIARREFRMWQRNRRIRREQRERREAWQRKVADW